MKLAIVIPGFQADEHDWCIPAFSNLARELSKSVDLHVFTLRYPGERRRYRVGDVKVHAIGGGALLGRRVVGASLGKLWLDALLDIRAEHRRGCFHAVVGIWATESGWLATKAAKMLGVASVVHLAGGELAWVPLIGYGNQRWGLARLLVGASLRSADLLTVPSTVMKRALMRQSGIEPRKVREWALGVDTQMFYPNERSAGERPQQSDRPFTFIDVGSLVAVKGHDLVLRGFADLRRMAPELDVRLQVVGDGPLLPRLRSLAAQRELTGYVDFTGGVSHEMLPAMYRNADCFVIGSWHEAQCMAGLEAMASGLPWVGPPVGALSDVAWYCGEKPSGVLVRGRNAEAFAHTMLAIASQSGETRSEWGRQSCEVVRKHYDLQRQTERLLEMVGSLIGKQGHE